MDDAQCKYFGSPLPLEYGCEDDWGWDFHEKADAVSLNGSKVAYFHPEYSYGTAAVRGNRVLNGSRYYFEVILGTRVFGTCMAVGIGTKKARLSSPNFMNLIGMDNNSWGYNHKGELWHNNESRKWTCRYNKYRPSVIGVYFDGIAGTLSFIRDGHYMGVAFNGLQNIKQDLYPMVCSTAARSTMSLGVMRREFASLQERCCQKILKKISCHAHIHELKIPATLKSDLCEKFVLRGDNSCTLSQPSIFH